MDSAPLTIACMGEKGPRLEARFKVLDSQGESERGQTCFQLCPLGGGKLVFNFALEGMRAAPSPLV